jgi:hypothetical protein
MEGFAGHGAEERDDRISNAGNAIQRHAHERSGRRPRRLHGQTWLLRDGALARYQCEHGGGNGAEQSAGSHRPKINGQRSLAETHLAREGKTSVWM